MRDIGKEIQENLDAIEERYKVKILLAVESGSRAGDHCHDYAELNEAFRKVLVRCQGDGSGDNFVSEGRFR